MLLNFAPPCADSNAPHPQSSKNPVILSEHSVSECKYPAAGGSPTIPYARWQSPQQGVTSIEVFRQIRTTVPGDCHGRKRPRNDRKNSIAARTIIGATGSQISLSLRGGEADAPQGGLSCPSGNSPPGNLRWAIETLSANSHRPAGRLPRAQAPSQ